jgi:hypothetical protein
MPRATFRVLSEILLRANRATENFAAFPDDLKELTVRDSQLRHVIRLSRGFLNREGATCCQGVFEVKVFSIRCIPRFCRAVCGRADAKNGYQVIKRISNYNPSNGTGPQGCSITDRRD